MQYAHPEALVDTAWLNDRLGETGLKIVDGTMFLPGSGRDAEIEFELRHLPGAVRFDIDDICRPDTDLPHMMPDAETFAAKVGALGIGPGDMVVVYDAVGGFCAAARVWWMFRVFGHENVALLDGGLVKWMKEKRPIEEGTVTPEPVPYAARAWHKERVRSMNEMLANIESGAEQVIDARNSKRFAGIDHEPRPTEKRGHIPGSVNVPFSALMDGRRDFVMRGADEVAAAFTEAGVDVARPVVCTCGSGVTAAVPAFALYLLGRGDVPIYDGSWAEWGNHPQTPVAPGDPDR